MDREIGDCLVACLDERLRWTDGLVALLEHEPFRNEIIAIQAARDINVNNWS